MHKTEGGTFASSKCEEVMHMGVLGSSDTQESVVREITALAKRTLYSLMTSGLDGENGLDPEACTHLLLIQRS